MAVTAGCGCGCGGGVHTTTCGCCCWLCCGCFWCLLNYDDLQSRLMMAEAVHQQCEASARCCLQVGQHKSCMLPLAPSLVACTSKLVLPTMPRRAPLQHAVEVQHAADEAGCSGFQWITCPIIGCSAALAQPWAAFTCITALHAYIDPYPYGLV